MSDLNVFGLEEPFFCDARKYFRSINHPGANNCACPKMDDGASCVPVHLQDAWFAYITGRYPNE